VANAVAAELSRFGLNEGKRGVLHRSGAGCGKEAASASSRATAASGMALVPTDPALMAALTVDHRTAIGLTGEPVAVGRRRGATTTRKLQRPVSTHSGRSSSNWR
jgi:hypothetical protein